MQRELLGFIACPVCAFPEMQVRPDKNQHAFGYCPDCCAQLRTGNSYRDARLRARLTHPTGAHGAPAPVPVPTPVTAPPPAPSKPAPKKAPGAAGFWEQLSAGRS